ncbi:MAG: OPT/YSL family transporter [Planctomycetes bacterium]|nr:OPT/YSL family transporter [Planctomycetota bacterium]
MSTVKIDKELEQFRSLMEVPSTFDEGFSWTALAGAVFIAILMVPGAMYMGLLAGGGVGPAAQWVTVILFIEVARRAHKSLKRAEIFVLFYMASAAMGQPFSGLLWNQFFVQSQAATGMGVAEHMAEVTWFAPTDPEILGLRSFFNPAWYPAIGMVIFSTIMGRLNGAILSYGLFRLASDVEKLPFPMAPVGAQGILALAEQQTEETQRSRAEVAGAENWRWRVFSIGGVLGLLFGTLYLALPAISTALLDQPIVILPIPFTDWTPKTAPYLNAVATGLSLDLGQMVFGMVLPFFAMVGSFIGFLATVIANPILFHYGLLPNWSNKYDTIQTQFSTNMDFYFSFGIGVAASIAIMGFWQVYKGLRDRARQQKKQQAVMGGQQVAAVPIDRTKLRGDIPVWVILATYAVTSLSYICLSGWLIDWHPGVMFVLVFFAYLYTPIISYVTTRLEGLAGQVVHIPMVREAAFILSGYQGGVKIWFLPIPLADYGIGAVFYRQAELTGTRFWSIWKAELVLMPIILVSSIVFAQFIWSLAQIPSADYPFADKMWELNAANGCIINSATLGRYSPFSDAFRWHYVFWGAGIGMALFAFMSVIQAPIMMIYGILRGLNQALPHVIIPQFIGALLGRFYFQRKLGLVWRQYVPVVAAGFACGMGLITVLGVGLNFLAKSVIKIPY